MAIWDMCFGVYGTDSTRLPDMARLLKRAIKSLAAKAGLMLFKRSTGIYIDEAETPGLVVRLCGKTAPVVVDGGAHEGAFVDAVRAHAPEACFVCFEPDPQLSQALVTRFAADSKVQVMPMALGANAGTARLNINASRSCNSLVEASSANAGTLGGLMATTAQVDVRVATLDEALVEAGHATVDIVKLDLQGFDLQALRGAPQVLQSAQVVVVEVWYAPVYAGTVNYLDIFSFMRENGFALYTLVGVHYSTSDRLLWSDAVFVRADAAVLTQALAIG